MQTVKIFIHLLRIAENYNYSYNLGIQIANVASKGRLFLKLILYGYYFYCFGSWFGIGIFDLMVRETVSLEISLIRHFECFGS